MGENLREWETGDQSVPPQSSLFFFACSCLILPDQLRASNRLLLYTTYDGFSLLSKGGVVGEKTKAIILPSFEKNVTQGKEPSEKF